MRSMLIFPLLLSVVGSAQAAPVTWNFDSVVVEQLQPVVAHANLTGSFTYDADTNVYSDILIQSGLGPYFGTTYTESAYTSWKASAIESPSSNGVIFNVYASGLDCPDYCDYSLTLSFGSALTNSGGAISLGGNEVLAGPTWGLLGERYIISGSVSAVPVPAAVWLFASALAGLGWLKRRQKPFESNRVDIAP